MDFEYQVLVTAQTDFAFKFTRTYFHDSQMSAFDTVSDNIPFIKYSSTYILILTYILYDG